MYTSRHLAALLAAALFTALSGAFPAAHAHAGVPGAARAVGAAAGPLLDVAHVDAPAQPAKVSAPVLAGMNEAVDDDVPTAAAGLAARAAALAFPPFRRLCAGTGPSLAFPLFQLHCAYLL